MLLQCSRTERNRWTYRIVEELPQSSEEEDASSSGDEWLSEQEGLANASISDSRAEV